jgi:hypothetical protein
VSGHIGPVPERDCLPDEEKLKALIAKAYHLGHEVGYFNHIEWVGWVSDAREEIFKAATEAESFDRVLEAYNGGKSDGRKERTKHFLESISVPEPIPSKAEWEEEVRLLLLELPKLSASPQMTAHPRLLRLPGMLRYLKF